MALCEHTLLGVRSSRFILARLHLLFHAAPFALLIGSRTACSGWDLQHPFCFLYFSCARRRRYISLTHALPGLRASRHSDLHRAGTNRHQAGNGIVFAHFCKRDIQRQTGMFNITPALRAAGGLCRIIIAPCAYVTLGFIVWARHYV